MEHEVTITVQHTISMGHRLPSYDGICSSPHGHNVRVEVEFVAPKDGFLDFKLCSNELKELLEPLDHAMVLWEHDPLLPVLKSYEFRTVALSHEPSTEAIACFVYHALSKKLKVRTVTVHETEKYSALVVDKCPYVWMVASWG